MAAESLDFSSLETDPPHFQGHQRVRSISSLHMAWGIHVLAHIFVDSEKKTAPPKLAIDKKNKYTPQNEQINPEKKMRSSSFKKKWPTFFSKQKRCFLLMPPSDSTPFFCGKFLVCFFWGRGGEKPSKNEITHLGSRYL